MDIVTVGGAVVVGILAGSVLAALAGKSLYRDKDTMVFKMKNNKLVVQPKTMWPRLHGCVLVQA